MEQPISGRDLEQHLALRDQLEHRIEGLTSLQAKANEARLKFLRDRLSEADLATFLNLEDKSDKLKVEIMNDERILKANDTYEFPRGRQESDYISPKWQEVEDNVTDEWRPIEDFMGMTASSISYSKYAQLMMKYHPTLDVRVVPYDEKSGVPLEVRRRK